MQNADDTINKVAHAIGMVILALGVPIVFIALFAAFGSLGR